MTVLLGGATMVEMNRAPTRGRIRESGRGALHRHGSYRWEAAGPGYRAWGAGAWAERVSFGRPVTSPRRSQVGRAVWWAVRLLQVAVGAGAAAGVVRSLERPRGRTLPAATRALPEGQRALPPAR